MSKDDDLICAMAPGHPQPACIVTRAFQRLLANAGLPKIVRLHDRRHAAATTSLRAGIPLQVVSDWLGPSTSAITADLSTDRVASLQADAAERLAALLRTARTSNAAAR